jgi:uncharacterized membrane protein YhaH (DUF805 family)
MGPKAALFSFDGRLRRLAYLRYGIMASIAGKLLLVGAAAIAVATRGGVGWAIGAALAALAVAFWAWATVAITAKRLHDLGLSALHLIWLGPFGVVCGGLGELAVPREPVLGVVLGLVPLGIILWLQLAPGQRRENRFGPAPGTAPVPQT